MRMTGTSQNVFVCEPGTTAASSSSSFSSSICSSNWRRRTRTRTRTSQRHVLASLSTRAFTLLEVLLAVAIFSIVLIAINTVFFAGLRLRQRVTENVEQSLPLTQALSLLRRDLQNAVPPGGSLAGNFSSSGPVAAGNTGTAANSSRSATPSAGPQTGGLDFFTSTGVITDDAPWGDIQEVNYQLMDPLDRANAYGRDLVRSVTRNLLATASQPPDLQRLLSNVQSLDFSFYDGTQWRDVWDTSAGDQGLPKAVRMRLQLAVDPSSGQRAPDPLQMVVLLETQSLTNLTQTAGGRQ